MPIISIFVCNFVSLNRIDHNFVPYYEYFLTQQHKSKYKRIGFDIIYFYIFYFSIRRNTFTRIIVWVLLCMCLTVWCIWSVFVIVSRLQNNLTWIRKWKINVCECIYIWHCFDCFCSIDWKKRQSTSTQKLNYRIYEQITSAVHHMYTCMYCWYKWHCEPNRWHSQQMLC